MANNLNNYLVDITAPSLYDANYAHTLQVMAQNIDDNFKKIISAPFMQGDAGENVELVSMPLYDGNNNFTDFGKIIIGLIYERYDIYDVIDNIQSYADLRYWLETGDGPEAGFEHVSCEFIAPGDGHDEIQCNKVQDLVVFNAPYFFVDARTESQYWDFMYNTTLREKFEDMSCALFGEGRFYNGEYHWDDSIHRYYIMPRLYWNDDLGMFCWKVNDQYTNVTAQGLKGDAGGTGHIYITRGYLQTVSNDQEETVPFKILLEQVWESNGQTWSWVDLSGHANLETLFDNSIVGIWFTPAPNTSLDVEDRNDLSFTFAKPTKDDTNPSNISWYAYYGQDTNQGGTNCDLRAIINSLKLHSMLDEVGVRRGANPTNVPIRTRGLFVRNNINSTPTMSELTHIFGMEKNIIDNPGQATQRGWDSNNDDVLAIAPVEHQHTMCDDILGTGADFGKQNITSIDKLLRIYYNTDIQGNTTIHGDTTLLGTTNLSGQVSMGGDTNNSAIDVSEDNVEVNVPMIVDQDLTINGRLVKRIEIDLSSKIVSPCILVRPRIIEFPTGTADYLYCKPKTELDIYTCMKVWTPGNNSKYTGAYCSNGKYYFVKKLGTYSDEVYDEGRMSFGVFRNKSYEDASHILHPQYFFEPITDNGIKLPIGITTGGGNDVCMFLAWYHEPWQGVSNSGTGYTAYNTKYSDNLYLYGGFAEDNNNMHEMWGTQDQQTAKTTTIYINPLNNYGGDLFPKYNNDGAHLQESFKHEVTDIYSHEFENQGSGALQYSYIHSESKRIFTDVTCLHNGKRIWEYVLPLELTPIDNETATFRVLPGIMQGCIITQAKPQISSNEYSHIYSWKFKSSFGNANFKIDLNKFNGFDMPVFEYENEKLYINVYKYETLGYKDNNLHDLLYPNVFVSDKLDTDIVNIDLENGRYTHFNVRETDATKAIFGVPKLDRGIFETMNSDVILNAGPKYYPDAPVLIDLTTPHLNSTTDAHYINCLSDYDFTGCIMPHSTLLGLNNTNKTSTQDIRELVYTDEKKYTITVNKGGVYDVTCFVFGGGEYIRDSIITLSAGTFDSLPGYPGSNYRFDHWSDGSTDSHRQITVTGDATYTAIFALRGTIVPQDNIGYDHLLGDVDLKINGTSIDPSVPIQEGTAVTIEATGHTGYGFAYMNITRNGSMQPVTTNPYTVELYNNMTVNVVFTELSTLTVTSADISMGTVTGGGDYPSGTYATITATPATGYVFTSWSDGNTESTRDVFVTGDATYIANFVQAYTITVDNVNPLMGEVTGGGEYAYGSTAVLRAIPYTGYMFQSWFEDGSTDAEHTVTVTADATYTAKFEQIPNYTLTVLSDDPTKGIVTGGGVYQAGTAVQITATPLEGYEFVQWEDDTHHATDQPIMTVVVNRNYTITAYFDTL